MANTLIAIPAYDPPIDIFIQLVLALSKFADVLIVNDGSSRDNSLEIDKLCSTNGVAIIRHSHNLGKGAAIKSAIEYAINQDYSGLLMVDADGQHSPIDVRNIFEQSLSSPADVIFGVRALDHNVPFRSKIGNTVMSMLVRLSTGASVSDTQTGLRYIPKNLYERCLAIKQNRYDFETVQLLLILKSGLKIKQSFIDTIYRDDNSASKFRPIIDSYNIFKSFIRFGVSGILSSVVDYICFVTLLILGLTPSTAVVCSRLVSMTVNFSLNYYAVFESSSGIFFAFTKYLILAFLNLIFTWWVFQLYDFSILQALILKICIESTLFIGNFFVQKYVVFKS